MIALLQFNLPTLLAAFAIGLATAWWMQRGRGAAPADPVPTDKGSDST
jgi:hypothetical protein